MAYFWSGYELTDFLFKGFDISTPHGFAGVFIGVASAAVIYEGLRTLRDFFFHQFLKLSNCTNNSRESSSCQRPPSSNADESERESLTGAGDGRNNPLVNAAVSNINSASKIMQQKSTKQYGNNIETNEVLPISENQRKPNMSIINLALSSLLHMLYMTLGYTLMLVVMTWNVYIFGAVVIGLGTGSYFFDPSRQQFHSSSFNFPLIVNEDDPSKHWLLGAEPTKAESTTSSNSDNSKENMPCHSIIGPGGEGPSSQREVTIGAQVHCQIEA